MSGCFPFVPWERRGVVGSSPKVQNATKPEVFVTTEASPVGVGAAKLARVSRGTRRKARMLQANRAAMGLPPSVTGTGRAPSFRSAWVSTPRAVRMVAWKSGTLTGSCSTFFDKSSVTP